MDSLTDWEETKTILQDLEELYQQNQDAERVGECIQLRDSITATYSEATDSVQDLIRNFSKEVDVLKQKAEELAGQPSSNPEIEELKSKIKQCGERYTEQQHHEKDIEAEVEALEKKMESLQLEQEELEKKAAASVPLMQHLLSLYANITKIKWDFSSESVAGVVSDAEGKGVVRQFDYSLENHTSFELANNIWDVISLP
uniref:Kinetochore protein Spc24 n=1 Tax=Aplanochytrium stocchinoi TaxID=215587 RepID=A0A7S3PP82_9STRA|mmetsp:Transcript_17488/g.21100  ORF Transcript_17488/g.21100 Transcript_17488/m.21100 type:complete len:200 (-) Transcript_17488:530-1129(-)